MSNYETPFFRDATKMIQSVGIGVLIALGIVFMYFEGVPTIVGYIDFIQNEHCIYFKEIGETLCGQEAMDRIWESNGV